MAEAKRLQRWYSIDGGWSWIDLNSKKGLWSSLPFDKRQRRRIRRRVGRRFKMESAGD